MPRGERLSTRLDSLLETVFEASLDPVSLYWDIAGHLRSDELAQAQKKIRKTLRQKGEIRAESAIIVACVLHLTGFPAHRILHFLSLYVPGGIRFALFELAVSAIFLGEPPIPASLLYDLTQYTYLEKRLLARRSIEISEQLRASLSPGVLLYLYLLSLRDDLSNENIQLIALIMKNCFPALEVRTRIGGASLEEYGEIARAWKLAEQRSLNLDIGAGTSAQGRGGRAFDRDSASFFLDKYFSDKSLAEMRVSAPPPAARKPVRNRLPARAESTERKVSTERTEGSERTKSAEGGQRSESTRRIEHSESTSPRQKDRTRRVKQLASASARSQPRIAPSAIKEPPAAEVHPRQRPKPSPEMPKVPVGPTVSSSAFRRGAGSASGRLLLEAPAILAAAVIAILLVSVPIGFRRGGSAPSAAVAHAGPAASPAGPTAASAEPLAAAATPAAPPPARTTYVVKPGDSLWKIFTSVRSQKPDRRGWMDFLSATQSMNSLIDPDRLQPGKVLTISVQE